MLKKLLLLGFLTGALVSSGSLAFAASPRQQQIEQPVIINGQQVQGVTVVTNGAVQSYTCPDPQQYVAADQSSTGWACYDQSTGTWLLHAQPAQASGVYDQSQGYYPDTAQTYGYYPYPYPYPYPYGYYPYPYYGYFGPSFAFGFGSGHGFHGDHNHFFAGHGPVGNGSFGHGSFGHAGGGHMGGAHFGGGGHMGGGHGGGRR